MLRRLLQALPPVLVLLPEPVPLLVQVPVLPELVQVLLPLLPEPVLHPDLLLQLHMSFRLQ